MNAHRKKIMDAYDKFGLVQNKFWQLGACDSEVSHEKVQVMYDALKGREWKPRSVDGWQLYSSERNTPSGITVEHGWQAPSQSFGKRPSVRTGMD